MNNKLILRTVPSPYDDLTRGSVLSHEDVDNNFIFLKGKLIQTGSTGNNNLLLTSLDGSIITIPLNFTGTTTGGTGGGTSITAVTFDTNNTLHLFDSTGGTFTALINYLSGLTVNGKVLVGTNIDNGQTLQVSGNSAIYATGNSVQQLIKITTAQTYSTPFFQVQDSNGSPIFAINTLSNTNLYFGVNTGIATTTGLANIAIGGLGFLSASTFMNNTTGSQNMAIGCRTLAANTTGAANTAIGDAALFGNIIGGSNVAIGQASLAFNTGNSNNIGIGQNAGHGMGSNYDRTILIGSTTFNQVTGGSDCIVIGVGALSTRPVSQGDGSIVIGSNAGHFSQFGGNNIILGFNAHSSNDMGNSNISIGSANSFTGAGVNNTTLIGSGMSASISNIVGIARTDQNVLIGQTNLVNDNGAKLQISGDTYINPRTAQPLNIDGGGNLLMQIGGPLGNSSALFGRFSNETLVSSSGGAFNVYLQGTKVYTTSRFVVNTANDNSSTLQVHGAPSLTGFSLTSATIETNWSTSGSPVLIQGNVISTSAFTANAKLLDLTVNGSSLFKIGAYGQISATTSVPNSQVFNGSWTGSTNGSYNSNFTGTFYNSTNPSDIVYGTIFSPTLNVNPSVTGNGQSLVAVRINPTFNGIGTFYALESNGNIQMSSVDPIIKFGGSTLGTGSGGAVFYMRNGAGYGMDISTSSFQINSQGSVSLGSQATDTNIFFIGRQDVSPTTARTFAVFKSPTPSGISPLIPTSGAAKFIEIGAGSTTGAGFATFQPTAGTATYTSLSVNDYVAQTGTSNGSVTMLDMTMNGNVQGTLYGIKVNNSNAINVFGNTTQIDGFGVATNNIRRLGDSSIYIWPSAGFVGDGLLFQYQSASPYTPTAGNTNFSNYVPIFSPTSGNADWSVISINPTINQSGGASGVTRGIYIHPTYTSATDFRAIEVVSGKTILNGGNVLIGTTVDNGYKLNVNGDFQLSNGIGSFIRNLAGVNHIQILVSNSLVDVDSDLLTLTSSDVIVKSSTGNIAFVTGNPSSTTKMGILNNGNVLIGTTTDDGTTKLQVNGGIKVGDGLDASPSYSFINYPNTGFHTNASGSPAGDIAVIICGNTVTSFRNNIVFTYGTFAPITNGIQSNGQYNQQWGRTYSTVFVSPFGTETNPNYNFQDGSDNIINNGMFATPAFLGFATISAATTGLLGMERMRINNSGNVLVNTKIDNGAKHQVNGNQSLGVLITGGSVTLSASATQYVYTGTGSTWTLPAVSVTTGWYYFIKNRGAGVLTLNSNSGGNDIYTSSAVNTLTFPPGGAYMLFCDGTFWNVQ